MKLALAVTLFVALLAAPVHAGAARDCQQRALGPVGVRALIVSAAPKIGVSTSTALLIAKRESRFRPWAQNPSSSACGVFQVVSGTWRSFVRSYLWGHLIDPVRCTAGRANVILSLRHAHRNGWGAWSTAP